ncbi:MAG: hypothetical protein L3J71_17740 [Victivallaceae bacterium]|nr:hypothetical protein [Victivallaceae bacterium]
MNRILIAAVAVGFYALLVNVEAGAVKPTPIKKVVKKGDKITVKVKSPKKKTLPARQVVAKQKTTDINPPEKWDFFQFGVWFDVPSVTRTSNVYGIKIGAPFCSGQGTVKGIETAVFCGATDSITGLQACIITSVTKRIDGLQFSIVNYAEEVEGLQLGVVNIAKKKSFQIGILNYIEDAAIPWLPIVNFKF